MRRFTVFAAVLLVGGIIGAGIALVFVTSDSSDEYREIREDYDIDDYLQELRDHGYSTWNPGRLWPGSIDPMVTSAKIAPLDAESFAVGNSYYIVNI